eukprot:COSAG03_NODE_1612_length_3770_cov_6.621666_4_plen_69_part_00
MVVGFKIQYEHIAPELRPEFARWLACNQALSLPPSLPLSLSLSLSLSLPPSLSLPLSPSLYITAVQLI